MINAKSKAGMAKAKIDKQIRKGQNDKGKN